MSRDFSLDKMIKEEKAKLRRYFIDWIDEEAYRFYTAIIRNDAEAIEEFRRAAIRRLEDYPPQQYPD